MPFLSDTKDIALIITSASTVLATLYFSRKNYTYQQNVLKLQETNLLLQQSNLEIQKENHQLQKSKENENELFKIKIEKYENVFKLGFQIHQHIREILTTTKEALEDNQFNEDEIFRLADEIDDKIDLYYDEVLLNLAFLPKGIYKLYDAYFDKVYKELETENDNQDEIKKAFKVLDEMEEQFFEIMDKMRIEIGYDTLNNKLRNRIQHNRQIHNDTKTVIKPSQVKK